MSDKPEAQGPVDPPAQKESHQKLQGTQTQSVVAVSGTSPTQHDPLHYRNLFPEPEAVFATKLRPPVELQKDAIVVLDTNVLLLPYTVQSKQSVDAIKLLYSSLIEQGRLVVPAQVATEFAKNRGTKLADLHEAINKVAQPIQAPTEFFHPLVNADLLKNLKDARDEVNKAIKAYRKSHAEVLQSVVRNCQIITELFDAFSFRRRSERVIPFAMKLVSL